MHWLTSDWHLGHINIAGPKVSKWKDGYRNFDSVKEMDKTIINDINRHVSKNDVIWMLGDFSFGSDTMIPVYRNRINCNNIHIIRGNHDHFIDNYSEGFTSISDYRENMF